MPWLYNYRYMSRGSPQADRGRSPARESSYHRQPADDRFLFYAVVVVVVLVVVVVVVRETGRLGPRQRRQAKRVEAASRGRVETEAYRDCVCTIVLIMVTHKLKLLDRKSVV